MYPLPMQQQQSRAIMQRHVQIVDHNQYRLPLVSVNIAQQLKNLILVRQIQIGQWLVKQHYRGLLSQCPRQHHTSQFSPAHLPRLGETQMPRIRLLHATLHNIPILLRLVLQTPLVRVAPHQHRLAPPPHPDCGLSRSPPIADLNRGCNTAPRTLPPPSAAMSSSRSRWHPSPHTYPPPQTAHSTPPAPSSGYSHNSNPSIQSSLEYVILNSPIR